MLDLKSREILDEKTLEIILNFKPNEKLSQSVINELSKLKEDIKTIITQLPYEEKEILELRYFQNLQLDSIAVQKTKTKDEISPILLRGIKKIKEALKKNKLSLEVVQNVEKIKEAHKIQTKEALGEISPLNFSFLFGFLLVLFLSGFFLSTYFILQKFVFRDMPSMTWILSNASIFEHERSVNDITQSQEELNSKSEVKKVLISKDPYTIKVAGSTSLFALSRRWENSFSVEFPKRHIELFATDSTSGVNSLIHNKVDVANSSRPVTYEDEELASKKGLELNEHRVAIDALVVIVNNKNPTQELSLDDLTKIFSGEMKNWDSIEIIPVVREKGSGTNDFAVDRILEGGDFSTAVVRKKSNKEIIDFVSSNLGAISFVNSTNYPWESKGIKFIKIKNYDNSLSFSPFEGKKLNEQALRYGDYPLTHYLYLVTLSSAPNEVGEFIDWVLSKKGQEIVRYSGLIPVNSEG